MDPELKALWLEALRSGEYKQGYECLRSPHEEWCALGVLADLIDSTRWLKDEDCWTWTYDGDAWWLPASVQEAAGISGPAMTQLLLINDCEKASFAQIAMWIEERL